MTQISPSGITLLKRLEGTVMRKGMHATYKDQAGNPTIGYGHLIRPGEHYDKVSIDERQATDLLHADLVRFELAVDEAVTVPLNQNEFDALVIFAFNIGVTAFRTKASAVRVLNQGNRTEVGRRMKFWDKITVDGKKVVSESLENRRAAEVKLFYAPSNVPVFEKPPEKPEPSDDELLAGDALTIPKRTGCFARFVSWLKGA